MKSTGCFHKSIPSDIEYICCLVGDVLKYFEHNFGTIDNAAVFELKVILNELLLNAIRHGNNCDPLKHVDITCGTTDDGYAFLIITDEGEGFKSAKADILEHDNCMHDICDLKETGRGLVIVKKLCDVMRFNEKGNKTVVLKKIHRISNDTE